MSSIVDQNLDALRAICERYRIDRLEVFGSAANPLVFDPSRSDVDFIVTFAKGADLGPWLASYFDLREELANLFHRPVDLVMDTALNNTSFSDEAGRTRRVIYAAKDTEAA